MGKSESRERWPGGYIHRQKDGQPVYVIERELGIVETADDGTKKRVRRRFHVSTRRHGIKAALKELERWEEDPLNYSPLPDDGPEPIYLTKARVEEFGKWQLAKGDSRKHVNSCKNRLIHWMDDLRDVDLRKANLRDHIIPALKKRVTMRAHRISTIKAFYGWLREVEHLLISAQDPTLDLPVPQAQPEKRKVHKALTLEVVQAAFEKLEGAYQDVLMVLAATGWHYTELQRFVRHPASDIAPGRDSTLAVFVTPHKNKDLTRTPIDVQDVVDAGQRLRERHTLPKRPNKAIAAACKAAEVPIFKLGVIRHTVGTWAADRGATKGQIAEFLNHKSKRTTELFYIHAHVPTVQVPLPRLKLVKKS